jgi:signal transduction histidine kinase
MPHLFSKDHRILERAFMEYQPFGISPGGQKIRDVSGATVRANVEYLEETVSRSKGTEAGLRALPELCRLLNERIADPAYHVTPEFLKNVWNSYSYEFVMFLGEFCAVLASDARFAFNVGKEKFISPLIQTLGRPFTVSQIYRMFPHFGQKFAKGSIEFGVGAVTDHSAILRMKYTEEVLEQFGPYRKRCAEIVCNSSKAALAAVPQHIHGLKAAEIRELSCIAEGDEYCEWQFSWEGSPHPSRISLLVGSLLFTAGAAYLLPRYTDLSLPAVLVFVVVLVTSTWLLYRRRAVTTQAGAREKLIEEQLRFVEARHEELREAYLDQEEAGVELRRKIGQLTEAYRQIEALNLGLETKVQERTAELASANNQLKQMDQLKSQFLAHVSHELRTPLTSIDGFAENMLDGLAGPVSEKQKDYLTRIKINGVRLANMIADLLDRSRIEARKLELACADVNLSSVAREVIEQLRPMAVGKRQALELQIDQDLRVWADADRLGQILTNLVENAIKYTPEEGCIQVCVRREAPDFANVSVIDTGPGIPAAAVPKLFDPFFRVRGIQTHQTKGLGLGLSIVKELVELHGGVITVRSDEGRGTAFHFTLPLQCRLDQSSELNLANPQQTAHR